MTDHNAAATRKALRQSVAEGTRTRAQAEAAWRMTYSGALFETGAQGVSSPPARAAAGQNFSHLQPSPPALPAVDAPPAPRADPAKKAAARILAAAARANGEAAPEMIDDPFDRTLKSVGDPKALAEKILAAGKRARGE